MRIGRLRPTSRARAVYAAGRNSTLPRPFCSAYDSPSSTCLLRRCRSSPRAGDIPEACSRHADFGGSSRRLADRVAARLPAA
jgi:hypothetical protein